MSTLEMQLALENYHKTLAEERLVQGMNETKEKGEYNQTNIGKGIMNYLIESYTKNVETFLAELLVTKRGVKPSYYKIISDYSTALDADITKLARILAVVTTKTVINFLMLRKNIANNIAVNIGIDVEDEVEAMAFFESDRENEKRFGKSLNQRVGKVFKKRFIKRVYKNTEYAFVHHSKKDKEKLGMQLIVLLIESTDLFVMHSYTEDKKSQQLVVEPTDKFMKAIHRAEDRSISRAVKYVPSIIPPKPWTSMYEGAYYGDLSSQVLFMRRPPHLRTTQTLKLYVDYMNELDLSNIYDAVNKIQSTPYRVHKTILELVLYYLDKGGGVAGLAETEPLPRLPRFPYSEKEIDSSEELTKLFKEHKKKLVNLIHKENRRKGRSLRAILILKLAQEFSKYDEIYFPMNIDFRGRVYPLPTGLNPQGDDMTKGLLQYANPVPVSKKDAPDALRWLAIHGAGLAGHDKISLEDRVQWVNDNIDNILSSAENPIDYRWWQEQDKPWQFLAWSMEYKRALQYQEEYGSLEGFACRCTIAYDGTCSGLQHYSCLLRDPIGGSAVNLIDHEKPSDIYKEVADKVLTTVKKDAIEGTLRGKKKKDGTFAPGTKALAEAWLANGINRKVCKRPVMTLAYGSGQYGFGDQIYEDTTKENPYFEAVGARHAAQYLAKLTWQAVQTTVVSAVAGMDFLKQIAVELATADMPVEWITPLGLPIQQMYLESKTESFQLRLGKTAARYRIYVTTYNEAESVDKRKQAGGIAPNFIHSLDATHLMMSINEASRQGCRNFSTVHDSFGTSLGEAARLRRIIREQMVLLYTKHNPLQEFKAHAEELLGHAIDIELPKSGNLDINCILDSKFVFH